MLNNYREVEWFGGPLDGIKVMIENETDSVLYPKQIDVLSLGKKNLPQVTSTVRIPIRKGPDNKEYLMWFDQTPA